MAGHRSDSGWRTADGLGGRGEGVEVDQPPFDLISYLSSTLSRPGRDHSYP